VSAEFFAVRGLSKRHGGVVALKALDLELHAGAVLRMGRRAGQERQGHNRGGEGESAKHR